MSSDGEDRRRLVSDPDMADEPLPEVSVARAPGRLRNQLLATVAATFGGCVVGLALGYTSTAVPSLQADRDMHVTSADASLIGAAVPLGALLGGLGAGPLAQRVGRRTCMVLLSLPATLGWLLIAYASHVPGVVAGRLFTGLAAGATSNVVPTYVSEAVEARVRGTMAGSFQLQVTAGVLLSYAAGAALDWRWLALLGACAPLVWLLLLCAACDSPSWLTARGRELEAHTALLWLRGPQYDVNGELAELRAQAEERRLSRPAASSSPLSAIGLLLARRQHRRPFVMSLVLMLLQQLCGVNAVIFYTNSIFSAAGSGLDAHLSTVLVGLVQLFSTLAGVALVDKLGRRPLLAVSDAVMAVCLLTLGVFFYLKQHGPVDGLGWLPLVSLMVYISAFSVGFGPIPWLMMGELFAPEVQGLASGLATCFNWSLAFVVTLSFVPLEAALTPAGAFWLFSAICVLGTAYILLCVYETRGRSLHEITEHFRH